MPQKMIQSIYHFHSKEGNTMNKIYKVIWSKAKHTYVVASEIAKGHTKGETTGKGLKKLAAAMLVAAALLSPSFAWAADTTTTKVDESISAAAVEVYTKEGANSTFATQDQLQKDVAATNELLTKKADQTALDETNTNLAKKADQTALDETNANLAKKADQTALDATNANLAKKADQTALDETNANLAKKANQVDLDGKADKATTLKGYGITNAYTKDEADGKFATVDQLQADVAATNEELAKKADKATTLEGYGITDAYTKTEVDNKVDAEKTARESADSALGSRTSALEAKTGSLNRVAAANSTSINESMTLKDKQYSATLQVNGSGAQIGVVNNSAAGLANDGGTAYTEYRARTGAILSKATNDISSTSSNGQVVDTAGDTTGEYSQVATAKSTGTTFTYSNDGGKTSTSTTIKGDSVSTGTVSATAGIIDETTTNGTSVKASQTVGQNLNALDERITNVKEYVLSETVSKTDAAVQDGAIVKAANTIGDNVTKLDAALAKETAARLGADAAQDKVIQQVNDNLVASVNTINESVKTTNENMAAGFTALSQADANEVATREAKDNELNERITNEANAIHDEIKAGDTALNDRITNVKEYLEKQTSDNYVSKTDAAVQDGAIVKAANTIGENVTNLDAALAKETAARIGADKAQDKVIQQVNQNMVDGFNTINKNMADGFTALNQADAKEAQERAAADAALDDKITAETSARVAADTKLVEAVNSGVSLSKDNVLQKNTTIIDAQGNVITTKTAAKEMILNKDNDNQITLNDKGIKVGTNSSVVDKDGVYTGGDTYSEAKAALKSDGSIKGADGKFTVNSANGTVNVNNQIELNGATGVVKSNGLNVGDGNFKVNSSGGVTAAGGKTTLASDGSIKAAEGKFTVNSNGGVKAADGKITLSSDGSVKAADGKFTVNSNGGVKAADGKITLSSDGSVKAADGKFTVDTNGAVKAANGNTTIDSNGNVKTMGTLSAADGSFKVDSNGKITSTGLDAGNGTIQTTGTVQAGDVKTGTLETTGDATIGGDLDVKGDLAVEGEFNAKTLSSKLDENNYTTINGGKTQSVNLKVDTKTRETQASASTFDETGSNAWAKDDDSIGTSSMTADKISQSLSDTGDHPKNIASRELSQNTDNKYEIMDSVVDEDGNTNTSTQTASESSSVVSGKDGKNTYKSYITQNLKQILQKIEDGNGNPLTSVEQTEKDITNTAKNGTITNDAGKLVNTASDTIANMAGNDITNTSTNGNIANTAANGTISNNAKNLTNTASENITNKAENGNISNIASNGTISNEAKTISNKADEALTNDAKTITNTASESVTTQIGNGSEVQSVMNGDGIANKATGKSITNDAATITNTGTTSVTNQVGENKVLVDTTHVQSAFGDTIYTTWAENGITNNATDKTVATNAKDILNTATGDITNTAKNGTITNDAGKLVNTASDTIANMAGNDITNTSTNGNIANTAANGTISNNAKNLTNTASENITNKAENGNISNIASNGTISNEAKTISNKADEALTNDAKTITNTASESVTTQIGNGSEVQSVMNASGIANKAAGKSITNDAATITNTGTISVTNQVGKNKVLVDTTHVQSAFGDTIYTTWNESGITDKVGENVERTMGTSKITESVKDGTKSNTFTKTADKDINIVTDGTNTSTESQLAGSVNTSLKEVDADGKPIKSLNNMKTVSEDTTKITDTASGAFSSSSQKADSITSTVKDGTNTSEVKQTASEVATSAKNITNTAEGGTIYNKSKDILNEASGDIINWADGEIGNVATKITNITGDNTVTSDTNGITFENTNKKDKVTFMGEEKSVNTKETTISGNTITTGEAVMDYADVMKDLGVRGNATIKGDTTMEGNASVGKDLTVAGTSTLTGDVTMENNATVKNNLTVEGETSLKNTKVDGTLNVTGKSTFNDTVSITKGGLEVAGGTTTDTLHVTSTATFDDIVTMKSDLNVGGNVDAASYKVDGKTYIDKDGINANGQVIKNVGKGDISNANSTDAVSGGQLYETNTRVSGLETRMGTVETKVDKLDNKIDKVGANAAAMANLHPLEFDEDSKWNIAAAVGSSGSETASAVGVFYRPNENVMVNASAAMGTGENMFGGGVSLRLGHGSNKAKEAQMKAAAKENRELRAKVDDLTARMDALLSVLNPNMSKDFPDVPENHWAYEAVSRLAGNGIVEGYEDGKYHGERQMTRYEMAEIIYNALSKGAKAEKKLVEEFRPELQAMAAQKRA